MPQRIVQLAALFDAARKQAWDAHLVYIEQVSRINTEVAEAVRNAGLVPDALQLPREFDAASCYAEHRNLLWKLYSSLLAESGRVPTIDIAEFDERGPEWAPRESGRRHRRRHGQLDDLSQEEAAELSLERLASRLLAELPSEVAHHSALREAAGEADRVMRNLIGYYRKTTFEKRNGRLVGSRWTPRDQHNSWKLAWDAGSDLSRDVEALRVIAEAEGAGALLDASRITALIELNGVRYQSRMTVEVGAGLRLVFFKTSLEFHFTPELMDAIQAGVMSRLEAKAA